MALSHPERLLSDLLTIRDWFRYGISRMHASDCFYGHGFDNPGAEVWALLAHVLSLPDDVPESLFDAEINP